LYQRGRVPPLQRGLAPEVLQIHAGDYRNPHRLPERAVLVIRSGASGCQIADELIEAGRYTYLRVGRHQRAPRRYRGRNAFWRRCELRARRRRCGRKRASCSVRPSPPCVRGDLHTYLVAH